MSIQVDRANPTQSKWAENAYIQDEPSASKPTLEIVFDEKLGPSYLGFPMVHTQLVELKYGENRFTQETFRSDDPALIQSDAEALHIVITQIDPRSYWLPTVESASTLLTDGQMQRSSFIWISLFGLCIRVISMILALAFFVVLFKRDVHEVKSDAWKRQGRCVACGYKLDPTLDRCSECGEIRAKL
ncbi:MAG: hypothetical protein JJ916_00355 [Phycisphaerales bacterium]|nr:hypothetical protein [Phycisphaerales bacterium]